MSNRINRESQMSYRLDPQYTNLPEDLMEEAMNIVETIESRKSGTDVINWEEKAEMDRISQQHGRGPSAGGTFYGGDEPQITEAQGKSENPKEQELMDDLAGIMNELEGYDGKR